jgi:hypothetical protein
MAFLQNPDVIPGLGTHDEISMEGMTELLAESGIVAGKNMRCTIPPYRRTRGGGRGGFGLQRSKQFTARFVIYTGTYTMR